LATGAHRQQGEERPEQDHQGQATDDVRRGAGTGLRRERHDSEDRHAVILSGRRRAGASGHLNTRCAPPRIAQKNRVRPAIPARKNTKTFIRSVPAIIAITKNGGTPTSADRNVTSPLTPGRFCTKSLQRWNCACRFGVSRRRFSHLMSSDSRQTKYQTSLPMFCPRDPMKASWSAVASERAYARTMYVSMLKT